MKLCNFEVGLDKPFFLIAGPCVIESEAIALETAHRMKEITDELGINYIYKSAFDKDNRSSAQNFRGLGMEKGLQILEKIKKEIGIPVLTDVHEYTPVEEVATVVDVLQTPAFLCRQTDFVQNVAKQGLPVNIKKGQYLAPWKMKGIVGKAQEVGNNQIMVCERGFSFGYDRLIVDMCSLVTMRDTNCPVVFDVTHAVQVGGRNITHGEREFVPALARAAAATGVSGFFFETHPNPDKALCDAESMWPLDLMKPLLEQLKEIDAIVKSQPLLEEVYLKKTQAKK